MSADIKRIGLIGLGKMGLPIGRHLVAKGFEVAGYDVSLTRSESGCRCRPATGQFGEVGRYRE